MVRKLVIALGQLTQVKCGDENTEPITQRSRSREITDGDGYICHTLDVAGAFDDQVEYVTGLDGGGDTDATDSGLD